MVPVLVTLKLKLPSGTTRLARIRLPAVELAVLPVNGTSVPVMPAVPASVTWPGILTVLPLSERINAEALAKLMALEMAPLMPRRQGFRR